MKLKVDMLEVKHWIYPLNQPKRDYQFNIVKQCLFENTLVSLPTGLGKTFIAGVVMLNCEFACAGPCTKCNNSSKSTAGFLRARWSSSRLRSP